MKTVALVTIETGVDINKGGPTGIILKIVRHRNAKPSQDFHYTPVFSISNYSEAAEVEGSKPSSLVSFFKRFSKTKAYRYLFVLYLMMSLRKKLRSYLEGAETGAEILINAHDVMGAYIFSRYFSRHFPSKLILSIHGVGSYWRETEHGKLNPFVRYVKKLEERGILGADIVTFPSRGAQALYKSDFKHPEVVSKLNNAAIVNNGIDTEFIDNLVAGKRDRGILKKLGIPNKRIVLTVANLIPSKGVDRIPELIKSIADPNAVFVVIGSGPMEAEIREKARGFSVQDALIIIPKLNRSDLIAVIREADVFLMPSRTTVFDLVMLEAMYLSGPIMVATDIPGHDEMIRSGVDGILTDPARLAEEIESVLRLKPQEREKIARSAQQRVRERFLISHMVEQYESVYKTSFSPSSDNQGKVRR